MSLYVIVLLAALIHIISPATANLLQDGIKSKTAKKNYRLPKSIKPIRYNITLEPNLQAASFAGSVIIELEALEDTKNITLHISHLNISENSVLVLDVKGDVVDISETSVDHEKEFYIIHLEQTLLKSSRYILFISDFSGILHSDNQGFYLAKYYDPEFSERRLATTQFEPYYARRAFPCFDEPALKAKFIVNLIRPENYNTISNEEKIYEVNLGNGRVKDTYNETVLMSTYLVAFVISDYKHTNKMGRLQIFAKPESIENGHADYALKFGVDVLAALETFLNINYTLSKMDEAAIPDEYYSAGAMENWGLVTYRESMFLSFEKITTSYEHQIIATTVAHEFAHQWFGNLVTTSWWRYVWLNEGFANYFTYYAASLIKPAWRLMDQFVVDTLQRALRVDSSNSTKAMNSEFDDPNLSFNADVTYEKGSSVIRMFKHFLTNDIFREGLTTYLEDNAFGAVEPSDLYRALQKTVDRKNANYLLGNLTISSILETWTSQVGYPVVNVLRDYNTGHITIEQERFLDTDLVDEHNSIWHIPVNYMFHDINVNDSNTIADFWITGKAHTISKTFPTTSWLIVNKQQTGYYRVNYDETNWNRLIAFLNTENFYDIPVLNRAQLMDDAFKLAKAGKLHYYVPLNLSKYISRETDLIPVQSLLNNLELFTDMLANSAEYEAFQYYVISSLSKQYGLLGLEEKLDDGHLDKINRVNILKWLCNMGHGECRNYALQKLRIWKQNNTALVTANLQSVVYCTAIKIGNQDDWNFLHNNYKIARNTTAGYRILNALGCSENENTLIKFLDMFLTKSSFKKDRIPALRAVYSSGITGLNVAFSYIESNFKKLVNCVADDMSTVLEEIGSKVATHHHYNRLRGLAEKHQEHKGLFEKSLLKAQQNVKWNQKFGCAVKAWFRDIL